MRGFSSKIRLKLRLFGLFLEFAKGDLMRVRSKAILAAVAALAIASGACGKVGNLQARKAFKEANALYQAQDY